MSTIHVYKTAERALERLRKGSNDTTKPNVAPPARPVQESRPTRSVVRSVVALEQGLPSFDVQAEAEYMQLAIHATQLQDKIDSVTQDFRLLSASFETQTVQLQHLESKITSSFQDKFAWSGGPLVALKRARDRINKLEEKIAPSGQQGTPQTRRRDNLLTPTSSGRQSRPDALFLEGIIEKHCVGVPPDKFFDNIEAKLDRSDVLDEKVAELRAKRARLSREVDQLKNNKAEGALKDSIREHASVQSLTTTVSRLEVEVKPLSAQRDLQAMEDILVAQEGYRQTLSDIMNDPGENEDVEEDESSMKIIPTMEVAGGRKQYTTDRIVEYQRIIHDFKLKGGRISKLFHRVLQFLTGCSENEAQRIARLPQSTQQYEHTQIMGAAKTYELSVARDTTLPFFATECDEVSITRSKFMLNFVMYKTDGCHVVKNGESAMLSEFGSGVNMASGKLVYNMLEGELFRLARVDKPSFEFRDLMRYYHPEVADVYRTMPAEIKHRINILTKIAKVFSTCRLEIQDICWQMNLVYGKGVWKGDRQPMLDHLREIWAATNDVRLEVWTTLFAKMHNLGKDLYENLSVNKGFNPVYARREAGQFLAALLSFDIDFHKIFEAELETMTSSCAIAVASGQVRQMMEMTVKALADLKKDQASKQTHQVGSGPSTEDHTAEDEDEDMLSPELAEDIAVDIVEDPAAQITEAELCGEEDRNDEILPLNGRSASAVDVGGAPGHAAAPVEASSPFAAGATDVGGAVAEATEATDVGGAPGHAAAPVEASSASAAGATDVGGAVAEATDVLRRGGASSASAAGAADVGGAVAEATDVGGALGHAAAPVEASSASGVEATHVAGVQEHVAAPVEGSSDSAADAGGSRQAKTTIMKGFLQRALANGEEIDAERLLNLLCQDFRTGIRSFHSYMKGRYEMYLGMPLRLFSYFDPVDGVLNLLEDFIRFGFHSAQAGGCASHFCEIGCTVCRFVGGKGVFVSRVLSRQEYLVEGGYLLGFWDNPHHQADIKAITQNPSTVKNIEYADLPQGIANLGPTLLGFYDTYLSFATSESMFTERKGGEAKRLGVTGNVTSLRTRFAFINEQRGTLSNELRTAISKKRSEAKRRAEEAAFKERELARGQEEKRLEARELAEKQARKEVERVERERLKEEERVAAAQRKEEREKKKLQSSLEKQQRNATALRQKAIQKKKKALKALKKEDCLEALRARGFTHMTMSTKVSDLREALLPFFDNLFPSPTTTGAPMPTPRDQPELAAHLAAHAPASQLPGDQPETAANLAAHAPAAELPTDPPEPAVPVTGHAPAAELPTDPPEPAVLVTAHAPAAELPTDPPEPAAPMTADAPAAKLSTDPPEPAAPVTGNAPVAKLPSDPTEPATHLAAHAPAAELPSDPTKQAPKPAAPLSA
ncbi:hypothetical protein CYMTET_16396, partial [Cymbomonas tetramitiformis]